MNEKIVETKTCKHCTVSFDITDRDLEFYEKVSPIFGGKKYLISPPTFCPKCRHQRRISFRNERKLYKRKCDFSGKEIISIYSPDKPFKVYDTLHWESDVWEGKDFGMNFDFTQDFFPQLQKLSEQVPHISRYVLESVGSDYINGAAHIKDSYLCFNVDYIEDSAYCFTTNNAKRSYDCSFCTNLENSYQCCTVDKSHTLFFSEESQECSNSYFLSNCLNCHYCFGCVNLVNRQYCIYNKQLDKEGYHLELKKILKNSPFDEIEIQFQEFKKPFPKRQWLAYFNTNSVADYSRQIKDSAYIFDSINIENSKYLWYVYDAKDCMDYDIYGDNSELIYEAIMTGTDAYKSAFCFANWMGCRDCYYSILLLGCKNCFGCVGLKNKQYCIFNKQYSKTEYEILVPQIIAHMQKTGEWGEYFPGYMAPCGYNESVAQDYFPLTREEVLTPVVARNEETKQSGEEKDCHENSNEFSRNDKNSKTFKHGPIFNWSDFESPFAKVNKIIPGAKLPNDITKIPDDVLNWAIECEITKKPFKIIRQELEFYRKHNLPLPKRHPDQRHLERLQKRNPKKFYERTCGMCGKNIQTTYSPISPEKIYCEVCYNKEVF